MGTVITAPNAFTNVNNYPSVFLAGGITNCEDWQSEVIKQLSNTNLLLYNPRREVYSATNSEEQIKWEFEKLRQAHAVVFWFSKETLCPITLFEYGKYLGRNTKPLFVACDRQYKRREDVIIQTALEDDRIVVGDSVGHLV